MQSLASCGPGGMKVHKFSSSLPLEVACGWTSAVGWLGCWKVLDDGVHSWFLDAGRRLQFVCYMHTKQVLQYCRLVLTKHQVGLQLVSWAVGHAHGMRVMGALWAAPHWISVVLGCWAWEAVLEGALWGWL